MSGPVFELSATDTLARVVSQVLHDLPDPKRPTHRLSTRWNGLYFPLGTGSDYTVFIHHLGISSVDMRFGAESMSGGGAVYGTYHSIYDSFQWMDQFGDPGFYFHQAMSQVWGVCALRLANAIHLPFHHVDQARAIQSHINKARPLVDPEVFQNLRTAGEQFLQAAKQVARERPISPQDILARNDRIALAEKKFLYSAGLPRRKWFKHVLQAPSLYEGYAPDILPGIVQAVRDENNQTLGTEQALVFCARLRAVSEFLLTSSSSFGDMAVA